MINNALYSSKTDEWATPQDFFDALNLEFSFTLDACVSEQNHKCARYYTKEQNGLAQDWGKETVFCNPPYGRQIGKWVRKCSESAENGALVVMLVPARTDTRWFHDYIYGKPGVGVRFIKGRLKFGEAKKPAPFPSMVVVLTPGGDSTCASK